MIVIGRHLPRRVFLKSLGTAIALPYLDAMTPAFASAAGANATARQAQRLIFTYIPNGVTMEAWTPAASGAGFEYTRILKPLEAFRDRTLVLSLIVLDPSRDRAVPACLECVGVSVCRTWWPCRHGFPVWESNHPHPGAGRHRNPSPERATETGRLAVT